MSENERRCVSANHCVARHKEPCGRFVGLLLERPGLCDGCRDRVRESLAQLPRDVAMLSAEIAVTGAAVNQVQRVSGTRERLTPLRLGIEALRAAIDFETQLWAEHLGMKTLRAVRLPSRVTTSVAYLRPRVDDLLRLGPMLQVRWNADGEPQRDPLGDRECAEATGMEGARRFVLLHHWTRTALGRSKLVHRLAAPCPRCDHRTLTRESGSDAVTCETCDHRILEKDYDWFARVAVSVLGRMDGPA